MAITLPLILFLLQLAAVGTSNPLDHIRSKIPVESVSSDSIEIAGLYVNPSKELAGATGITGMTTSLYLFPHGTYLYSQRNTLLPFTIFDKGTWRSTSNILELKSDKEVVWNPDLERRFVMIRRSSRPDEILLVGTESALAALRNSSEVMRRSHFDRCETAHKGDQCGKDRAGERLSDAKGMVSRALRSTAVAQLLMGVRDSIGMSDGMAFSPRETRDGGCAAMASQVS